MGLLEDVTEYLRRTGTPPTRFGRDAAGDPRLVGDLAKGRTVGDRLGAKVRAFIAAQREAGR